ncbi:MAG: threonine ammonia-lyase [Thermomicrobiales bacterium]
MDETVATTGATTAEPDVAIAEIEAARKRIAPYLSPTPLFDTQTLSRMTRTNLRLKAENLQRTGSFKVRGALNAVLQLSPEQQARGVVTFSAGNHGQGLAYAAALAGVSCTVFMAVDAVPTKVEAIRGYGAETRFGQTIGEAFDAMETYRDARGLTFVHPFADAAIIAGQGTVGLEILEAFPEVEQIVVPVGGGGLLAGLLCAVKPPRPDVRIVGVEPEGSAVVTRSLRAGRPLPLERNETIADGLSAPFAADPAFSIIARGVDDMILLTDDEIAGAVGLILGRAKLLVEPAGAAAVAALLTGKVGVPQGANTAAILSGGNIDLERLKELM